eukprot:1160360-Pelagomonas_calceolata.AAC.9
MRGTAADEGIIRAILGPHTFLLQNGGTIKPPTTFCYEESAECVQPEKMFKGTSNAFTAWRPHAVRLPKADLQLATRRFYKRTGPTSTQAHQQGHHKQNMQRVHIAHKKQDVKGRAFRLTHKEAIT